jgi:hypothetical protein
MRLHPIALVLAACSLAWSAAWWPVGALAQIPLPFEAPVPDPPPATQDDVSDLELVRWAANEVRLYEGRAAASRPPVPPDSYLGSGSVEITAVRGEDGALRVVAEVGGGLLGLLIGAGIGSLAVWGALEVNADPIWTMVAVGTATTLGAFGVTAGVVVSGEATGGRGSFGHTFIGQLVGSALAVPLVTLGLANDLPALSAVAVAILPLTGAMFGYEVSHANREGALRHVAFVRPAPGGAMVGMAGEVF